MPRAHAGWYIGYSRNPSPPDEDELNDSLLTVCLRGHRGEAGQLLCYSAPEHSVWVIEEQDLRARRDVDSSWSLPACSTEELAEWLDGQEEAFSSLRDTFHLRRRSEREQARIEVAIDDSLDAVGEVH